MAPLPGDPRDKDIAFEIGRFYYGIRHYKKALEFYRDSSVNIGEHHVTYHNMGLCQYSMGESAIRWGRLDIRLPRA
jgi:Tfp pilus assembly protein PilF